MGRHARTRVFVGAACVAGLLAGCGGGHDAAPPTTTNESLATALRYVPANLRGMQFGDTMAWLKDHGYADESPADLVKDDKFWRESQDASYAESNLWQYARAMDGWGWSATDIAWSASASSPGDTTVIHYVRFRDSTDLGTVRKSLVAHGYKPHGRTLVAPPFKDTHDDVTSGLLTIIGQTVRFYPDKHLMVSSFYGPVPDLPDEDESLGARAEVRTTVAPIATASLVTVNTGKDACRTPRNVTPMVQQRLANLGRVSASAAAVVNDSKSIATVAYSSDDAAKDDLPHRKAFLKKKSLRLNKPYESIAHFAVSRKGSTLQYSIIAKPRIVPDMLRSADSPWNMCAPAPKSGKPSRG